MNANLIKDLEKAFIILKFWAAQTDNVTVESEIDTAAEHINKAIEWEKNRP